MKRGLLIITVFLAGCGGGDILGESVSEQVRRSDLLIKESRTLSGLAQIESSLTDYYKSESKIPKKLEVLIPNYIADIPIVAIGVRGHRDNSKIKIYSKNIIRGGRVDGSRIDDTGRWGYVFNDKQVIVFVDCTHRNSKGEPWYRQRGVY